MSVLLAAPILLTFTLLVSGLAKLGARQGTEEAMTSLRLPLRPLHRTVASVLPVTEIVLALVLWIPSVPLQTVVAVLIAALMVAYLFIIGRALTFDELVECSCFGSVASPTVSKATLGRNLLLTACGVLTVVAASSGALTSALVHTPLLLVNLGIALLLAVALTVLTLGGTSPSAPAAARGDARGPHGALGLNSGAGPNGSGGPADGDSESGEGGEGGEGTEEDELLDYERTRTPAAVLQQPDGGLITLTQLTAQRAALLIFVSEGCGPCERVLDQAEGWISELSPFLQVRFVFSRPLDQLRERTTARVGEEAMHDLQFTARTALGGRTSPSAVLLGADGQLAGGPVGGGSAVIDFIEEIREQLASTQSELPSPAP